MRLDRIDAYQRPSTLDFTHFNLDETEEIYFIQMPGVGSDDINLSEKTQNLHPLKSA